MRNNTCLLILALILLTGCSTTKQWRYLPESITDERQIYVVNHGWHTGVAIPATELGDQLAFLRKDFDSARYFEFGWGDKDYFQASEITSSLTIKAALWPTDSVMLVTAIPDEPGLDYGIDIVAVRISSLGMEKLVGAIAGSFGRDEQGNVVRLKSVSFGRSAFYEGEGRYYLANTCNTWVARLLDSAGVPVSTLLTLTAESIMRQTRKAVSDERASSLPDN